MAKSYSVSFDIRGSIDGSLLAAIKSAQKDLEALGKLNGKSIANAQKLTAANKKLADIEQYKKLTRAIQATNKARLQEIQNASRANAQLQAQQKNLAAMKNSYKELQKVQARLKGNAQVQKNGVDLARADLKNAKKSGDINAIRSAQAALERQQQSARRAAEEVKAINAALKQGKAELKSAQADIRNFGSSFAQSSDKARQLSQQLAQQRAELANVQKNLSAQGINGNLGQQEVRLRQSIQETTNALNQEIAALERRNQVFNNFSQRQQDLANAWSNFQNALSTADTIMSPFKSSIDKAVEFQHTISTLKSISQMDLIKSGNVAQAEANMKRLTAQAKELGATTIYTAQQVGEAQVYIARTGWNTDQIEKSMPSILKLAAANRMAIEPTADIVTNVMTAFGHGVDQIEHDTDVFAYTVTHSNQTLSQFGEAMKYSAPVAKLFVASIEEAAMMTKFMGDAGVQGSMAGTSMRQMMLRLTAPTKNAKKAIESLGMTMSDARKEQMEAIETAQSYGVTIDENMSAGRKFISIMEQLDRGFAGKSDDEKLAALKDITGITAVSGAANVFGAGAGQAKNFTELLEQCRGALSQTYDTMTDDTFGAQKSFESAWEAVQLSVGESLLGITRAGYEVAAPILTSLSQFIDAHPQVVQAAFAIASALVAATVAVAGFSLALAGVRFAQAGWATAGIIFGDLATKITALRTALAGLTLANVGASLSSGLTVASAAARAFGASMLTAARAAMMFALTPVGAVLTALAIAALYAANNWDRVAPAISKIGSIVSSILVPAFERAKDAVSNLLDIDLGPLSNMLSNIASGVGAGLTGAFIILGGIIATVISTAIAMIADFIKMVANAIDNVKNFVSALTSGDLSGAWGSFKNFFFQGAKDGWSLGENAVKNFIGGMSMTDDALTGFIRSGYNQPADAQTLNTQPIQQAVDTSSQALGQISMPAQETGTSLQSISMPAQELAGAMPMLPPELNNMTTAAQMTGPELTNVGTSAQVASPSVDTLGTSSAGAGGYIQALGGVAIGASVNIAALSGAASAVAGALQAKAAEIAGIVINVPQVNFVPMSVPVAASESNATGGIYSKGAFLTSFAEDSAEAAIPLDGSPRAISLWQQAGSMLGMDSYSAAPNFNVTIHVNISGNANADDVQRGIEQSLPTLRRSFEEEYYNWQHERARRSYS